MPEIRSPPTSRHPCEGRGPAPLLGLGFSGLHTEIGETQTQKSHWAATSAIQRRAGLERARRQEWRDCSTASGKVSRSLSYLPLSYEIKNQKIEKRRRNG